MTPEEMAALHALAFAGQGRAWSAREFAGLLESPLVFADGDTHAFGLARVSVDEAEILTIATDPALRRTGLARAVLHALEADATDRGARRIFLEVADDNVAALGLYHGAGYREIARRRGYYARPDGQRADALILQKMLA